MNEKPYNLCALRIKEALNDHSLKAIELSEITNLSKATISHYVTGTRIPSRLNARIIGEKLGVNPAWLMGFDVPKYDRTEEKTKEILLAYYSKLSPEKQESVLNLIKTMI